MLLHGLNMFSTHLSLNPAMLSGVLTGHSKALMTVEINTVSRLSFYQIMATFFYSKTDIRVAINKLTASKECLRFQIWCGNSDLNSKHIKDKLTKPVLISETCIISNAL